MIGVLGVIDDVARRTPQGFRTDGALDLPARRHPRRVRRVGVGARRARLPRRPAAGGRPRPRAGAGRRADRSARDGLLDSAHDLAEGGLAQALVEAACAATVGARIELPDERRPVRRAVQRVDRARGRVGAAPRRGALRRAVRAHAACPRRASAWSTSSTPTLDVAGPVLDPAARAARRLDEPRCPPASRVTGRLADGARRATSAAGRLRSPTGSPRRRRSQRRPCCPAGTCARCSATSSAARTGLVASGRRAARTAPPLPAAQYVRRYAPGCRRHHRADERDHRRSSTPAS